MYYLYKIEAGMDVTYCVNDFLYSCRLDIFKPSLIKPKVFDEQIDFKALIVRLLFIVMTKGKMKIYILRKNNEIIHTSCVIPKCFKFPFMSAGDLEIGPCKTIESYRRRGCYVHVLQSILSLEQPEKNTFYMLVNESNDASIHGIEKAGFKRVGRVKKVRGIYKTEEVL